MMELKQTDCFKLVHAAPLLFLTKEPKLRGGFFDHFGVFILVSGIDQWEAGVGAKPRGPVRVIYPLPAPRTRPDIRRIRSLLLGPPNDSDNYTFYSNFTLPWNLITALYLNIPLSLSHHARICYSELVINRLILSSRHPHSAKLTHDMKPGIEKHPSKFSALFKWSKIKKVVGFTVKNTKCTLLSVFLFSNVVLFPCLRKVV